MPGKYCIKCNGRGSQNCTACIGYGYHTRSGSRSRYDGGIEYYIDNITCGSCSGMGKITCFTCGGSGLNKQYDIADSISPKTQNAPADTTAYNQSGSRGWSPDWVSFVIEYDKKYEHPLYHEFYIQYIWVDDKIYFYNIPGYPFRKFAQVEHISSDSWYKYNADAIKIPVLLRFRDFQVEGCWINQDSMFL